MKYNADSVKDCNNKSGLREVTYGYNERNITIFLQIYGRACQMPHNIQLKHVRVYLTHQTCYSKFKLNYGYDIFYLYSFTYIFFPEAVAFE